MQAIRECDRRQRTTCSEIVVKPTLISVSLALENTRKVLENCRILMIIDSFYKQECCDSRGSPSGERFCHSST